MTIVKREKMLEVLRLDDEIGNGAGALEAKLARFRLLCAYIG